jgi:hypothetical protein
MPIPSNQSLTSGDFSTIRLRPLKIAVRIKETASRVRLAFASNCSDQARFRDLVGRLLLRPTSHRDSRRSASAGGKSALGASGNQCHPIGIFLRLS